MAWPGGDLDAKDEKRWSALQRAAEAVVFDGDRDFEGPRAPKAHLDTVNTNLLDHLGTPPVKDTA